MTVPINLLRRVLDTRSGEACEESMIIISINPK